jgi:hypothetical protein
MEDLEVLLDHAEGRLGDGVCGWLEASLQVSWDCWSTISIDGALEVCRYGLLGPSVKRFGRRPCSSEHCGNMD